MAWRTQCTELFSQYKELLTDFIHSLEEFKGTLNSLEQCVDFKDYDELEYWRNRAEVGYSSDLKYFHLDRKRVINDRLLTVR